ncbi:MAG TPA: zinc ribbon domain-containing protein [Dehalococcoidia bacterium]|nr:zinc ribbon domain-containing protein [Dehalococcoidia bacterium]
MRCPKCGAYGALDDNFCRRCGATTRNSRLPVQRRGQPPVVWRRAAPAVVRGAALVAAGVAAEWLLRTAARRALGLALPPAHPKGRALVTRRRSQPDGGVAVSETVVMRRVIVRR